jgi:hypothetical protein
MRPMFTAAALASTMLLAQGALAQTQPARPGNPPAASADRAAPRADAATPIVAMTALENGANSFTEGQARSRFEEAGITGIEALQKDDNGVWRGRGMRGSSAVDIAMDFRGRIATAPHPMPGGASMTAPRAAAPATPATPPPAAPATR